MMETNHPASGPPPAPPPEEHMGAALAIAQFVVTGVLLGVVATLAYMAGVRSAGTEGGHATASTGGNPGQTTNVAILLKPTPELIAEGKTLFAVNCASCHGAAGQGNGPAAMALNPKPRNFHEGYWKYGGGVARIVQTISTGSPGTAMAAFTNIPLEDRFAIAHFVRSFSSKPEEDKPADLAWLGPIGTPAGGDTTGGTVAGVAPGGPPKPALTIPIELALMLLAEPNAPTVPAGANAPAPAEGRGSALYAERCASCHGGSGEGGIRVRMLGSAPYAYVATRPLSASRTPWAGDPARFEKLIVEGIPGYVMPGNGDLSREDIRALYESTAGLRARQSGTTTTVLPPAPAPAPAGANRS